ncbi:DEAD/DEAH box helicase [Mycobacterium paraffinicum]|uniref:SNF2-related protein n=1 Tax=Mycobacterium paraffinicum TaxID=53378 RepID=UPI0021F27F14|nr:DEAD/DEAH box helicase [Mycobacterium paraffinicum]MCV7311908.1 DEAD/DEAH box helicase [Mycobacterium paraffinicum]
MTEGPLLHLSLEGAPLQVVVRAEGVGLGEWYRISLLLAGETPPPGQPLLVQPERFLRERIALLGLLREVMVGLQPDDGIRELLARSRDDQRALTLALRRTPEPFDEPGHDHDGARRLRRELRRFQQRDFEILSNLRHGANFSVPGSGKTTVAYVLHARERAAGRCTRLLVIAPLSAFGAWEEDAAEVLDPPLTIGRFSNGPVPDTDVVLVNYHRLPTALPDLTNMLLQNRTHLVLDEAHRAKRGMVGEWGSAVLSLAPFAIRRDVLTGTPAPNHPRDLATILDILWPGGVARQMLPPAALRNDPPPNAMRDMNRIIAPLYARTTKVELGLRDPIIIIDRVPMTELQQDIYDAMLSRYAGMLDLDRRDAAMFAQMGEVTMYLLQAASSPRLLSANADAARAYRFPSLAVPAGTRLARLIDSYADHEIPAKIQRAMRIVHANAQRGRKTLVWSNFPGNLLDLERNLAGLRPALVYGAVPSAEDAPPGVRTREREIERFRHDDSCLVLLANPAAMSEGVSLHRECHDAIYIDRTFNAGQYLQSLDRIHRLGLEPDVDTRITLLCSEGSIDERINNRVADKARRLATLLNDQHLVEMALPDDEEVGEPLDDTLDLTEVLDHLSRGLPDNRAGEV